jgi:hypothetical protein
VFILWISDASGVIREKNSLGYLPELRDCKLERIATDFGRKEIIDLFSDLF